MLLLEEYRQQEEDMFSGKLTHKKVWDRIAQIMNDKGYSVTGKQCSTRINTMKRTYKAVKDHNGRSGNNKRTWDYFEIMEDIFGKKPYMSPIATISSTLSSSISNIIPKSRNNSSSSSSSSNTANSSDVNNAPKKRKTDSIAEAIVKNRKITELEKERRHKEKMEIKLRLLEKLDKILDKI